MATTKRGAKSTRGTGKGAKSSEIDTSAPASDDSGTPGETTVAPEGSGSKGKVQGDPTGKSGPIINTGKNALPNDNARARTATPAELKKADSKELYLDQTYTFNGVHYPASKHPEDLIRVPKEFPEHILPGEGEAPSLEEWADQQRSTPPSAVIEVPEDKGSL